MRARRNTLPDTSFHRVRADKKKARCANERVNVAAEDMRDNAMRLLAEVKRNESRKSGKMVRVSLDAKTVILVPEGREEEYVEKYKKRKS